MSETKDGDRESQFNCYECATPLIGPLCPACNPQGLYTRYEIRLAAMAGMAFGIGLGALLRQLMEPLI